MLGSVRRSLRMALRVCRRGSDGAQSAPCFVFRRRALRAEPVKCELVAFDHEAVRYGVKRLACATMNVEHLLASVTAEVVVVSQVLRLKPRALAR